MKKRSTSFLKRIGKYYDYESHPVITSFITVAVFPIVAPYLLFLFLTET